MQCTESCMALALRSSSEMYSYIEIGVAAFAPGFICSLSIFLCLDAIKLGHVWKTEIFFYVVLAILMLLFSRAVFSKYEYHSSVFGFVAGGIFALLWLRCGVRYWDRWISMASKKSLIQPDKISDIRSLHKESRSKVSDYSPWDYFKKGAHFMGLDEESRPYYINELPHAFYGGTTGSGKGNALQAHAAQSVLNDEALIYFDPKDDKYGPHALYEACKKYNKNYQYINVGSNQPAQFNLMAGMSERDLVQIFQSGFDLTNKGTDADHHRGNDRKAARYLAGLISSEKLTLAEAFQKVSSDDFFLEKASGFLEKLESIAGLAAINAKSSEQILDVFVREGGAIYVQSGLDEDAEKIAQRMILIRVIQIASSRSRLNLTPRTVCVIADEVRFQISRPLLNLLSAGRDKGLRAILAFQSMVDLRAGEIDMSPDVVEGIVLENTPIKHIYRLEDPRTAQWLAEKSGQVLVRQESYETRKNLLMVERLTNSVIREERVYLLDPNVTLSLAPGWGVFLNKGRIKCLFVSKLPCALCSEAISIKSCLVVPYSKNDDSEDYFSMENI